MNEVLHQTIVLGLQIFLYHISLSSIDKLLLFSSIHQSANLDFDIYFKQRPKLSEQSLPHQWRSIDNWNNSRLQNVQNSESESGHLHPKVKVATFTKKYMKNLLWKRFNWILQKRKYEQTKAELGSFMKTFPFSMLAEANNAMNTTDNVRIVYFFLMDDDDDDDQKSEG